MKRIKKKSQKQTEVRKVDTCEDTAIMAVGNIKDEPTEHHTADQPTTGSDAERAVMVDRISTN